MTARETGTDGPRLSERKNPLRLRIDWTWVDRRRKSIITMTPMKENHLLTSILSFWSTNEDASQQLLFTN